MDRCCSCFFRIKYVNDEDIALTPKRKKGIETPTVRVNNFLDTLGDSKGIVRIGEFNRQKQSIVDKVKAETGNPRDITLFGQINSKLYPEPFQLRLEEHQSEMKISVAGRSLASIPYLTFSDFENY